jgi:hypothetical protein
LEVQTYDESDEELDDEESSEEESSDFSESEGSNKSERVAKKPDLIAKNLIQTLPQEEKLVKRQNSHGETDDEDALKEIRYNREIEEAKQQNAERGQDGVQLVYRATNKDIQARQKKDAAIAFNNMN